MTTWIDQQLKDLKDKGLYRSLRHIESPQSKTVIVDGRELINFCSNNYLGLADDTRLVAAAKRAMDGFGFGSGASRLVCGNMPPHEELERKLSQLKQAQAGLLFNSGFAANTGIIPALMGRDDVVFCDKLNHASIIEGIVLSRAELKRYPHLDMEALQKGLQQAGNKRKLIVTDTVFSMDGDRAPLAEIIALAQQYEAYVMVDEAHGFGVLGQNGGGLAQELGLSKAIDVQMGTLSKAAGCFGAYACVSAPLREYLINHARSFIYTTSLPPAIAAAASAAVDIIQDPNTGGKLRRQVQDNADYVRRGLKDLGFNTLNSTTPIIPIIVGDASKAVEASRRLLEQGLFVQAIRPPTVPMNTARLRVTVMAGHTKEELERLLSAMKGL